MSIGNISKQTTSSFTSILVGACAGAALIAMGSISAQAFPVGAVEAAPEGSVILVADDCGIGRWRGPEGRCHWDRERVVVAPGLPVVPPVVVEAPVKVCPIHMHWSVRRGECVFN
jgi:hypothetical protein